jgi:small subunit ribosomal protein S18
MRELITRRCLLPRKDRDRDRGGDRGKDRDRQKPGRPYRKKVCQFCKDRVAYIDFKDTTLLRRFVSDRGKIRARRVTGTCTQHQRELATAVKNAREVALLPYVVR